MLEAALAARVAYMDVCDDADYSQRARGYHERAVAAGVPAITTAGIYPGVSNVRAYLFAAFDPVDVPARDREFHRAISFWGDALLACSAKVCASVACHSKALLTLVSDYVS